MCHTTINKSQMDFGFGNWRSSRASTEMSSGRRPWWRAVYIYTLGCADVRGRVPSKSPLQPVYAPRPVPNLVSKPRD